MIGGKYYFHLITILSDIDFDMVPSFPTVVVTVIFVVVSICVSVVGVMGLLSQRFFTFSKSSSNPSIISKINFVPQTNSFHLKALNLKTSIYRYYNC